MLRVLTLATLFPNGARPELGVFVARQTRALAAQPEVAVEVVAPLGLPVWPLSLHPRYAPLRKLPLSETVDGLVVHRPRYRIWPGPQGQAGTAARLASALLPLLCAIRRRFQFDVIDAEYFWPDGPAAMRLADALGIPFSVKARGSDIHLWGARPAVRTQLIEAGKAAGGLLAVSGALKADMAALGMPDEKIAVHHTGVDLDRFAPAAGKEQGARLIVVGHLIPRKGQDLALRALATLPEASLTLVGDGPERARLEALAHQLGLAGRVHFLGAQPHAALPGLIAAANVLVLPTVSEGLANVWVEALACGVPVVTSDVGGARDVIDRPEAGRLVPREPEAIAAAVRALLADPPDPDKVREGAARFSWDRNGAELAAHLREIAS
ncbi:MAG TPA: glycosyltransferase [Allosphingosinicella sp.]|nr:glycosyltransferase [Allosphingosinicella sp.]